MADWGTEKPSLAGCSSARRRSRDAQGRLVTQANLEGEAMGKRARKKKDRRKNNANHGKRPNAGRG